MRTLWITALVGVSLVGAISPTSAQKGNRDYGCDAREYGSRSYGEHHDGGSDRGDDDDDDDRSRKRSRSYNGGRGSERGRIDDKDRQRGRGYDDDDRGRERSRRPPEESEAEFDEDEYLRCNTDVRRAVERGEMKSGESHYRSFGRREGRHLTCPLKL